MAQWQNRITGQGEVLASSFLAHPQNWRIHPKRQQDAMRGALEAVGFVQQVIVNQRTSTAWPPGERNVETLVDGHMRVEMSLSEGEDTKVPVVYVDLEPDEEALVLATLDPLALLAGVDREKRRELSGQISRHPNRPTPGDAALMALVKSDTAASPDDIKKLVLSFTPTQHASVTDALAKRKGSPEEAVMRLLKVVST